LEEANEVAQRQLVEVMAADGTNTHATFKAIGLVNGLEIAMKDILQEKIEYYSQKTKEENVQGNKDTTQP
jgi:hypothetical protein